MITIATPCYNHGRYLEEAILSVLNQSYEDFKYILVNDGSTDNSLEIMEKYKKLDKRIELINQVKQKNKAFGLNKTISTGLWLWCPADDILKKDCLKNKIENYAKGSVIYNYNFDIINEYGKFIQIVNIKPKSIEEFWDHVWTSCEIAYTGTLIDCEIFTKIGKFPEFEDISEDFYWTILACINKIPFIGVDDNQHFKRINPESVTSKNKNIIVENTNKIRRELWKLYCAGIEKLN